VDVPTFIKAAFSEVKLALRDVRPDNLWHVGRATWLGRSREIYFGAGLNAVGDDLAKTEIATHPKALLFTPLESSIPALRPTLHNSIISLECAARMESRNVMLDDEYIEERLIEANGPGSNGQVKRRPRRSVRTTAIESLTRYMVAHLQAARDHAISVMDISDEPQLLPRPKQNELAKALKLSEHQVSRCMNDPEARELRIYYETAADLNAVLAWSGPASRSRKSHLD
jgi:hypothetical protein